MGAHITSKTTIEISKPLLTRARRYAKNHQLTLKTLFERALSEVMSGDKVTQRFKLRRVVFTGGSGLTPEFADKNWEGMRDEIYPGPFATSFSQAREK